MNFEPIFVITLQDVVGGIFLGLFLVAITAISLYNIFKQAICKHDDGVNETMACDAICRKCGKNLGFIGTWREKHKNGNV